MLQDMNGVTESTKALVAKAILEGQRDPAGALRKDISVSTGLIGYNLQQPAKQLVPLLSPFQQSIPRKVKAGANSDNWRTISAIGSPKLFTAEKASGAAMSMTLSSSSAAFKVAALVGNVTLEAIYASQGFDPALAKESANTLLNAMKLEGQYFMGGTYTSPGNIGTVTVANDTTAGGTITTATYYVYVVGLTLPATNRISLTMPSNYGAVGVGHTLAGSAVATVNGSDVLAAFTVGCGLSAPSTVANSGALTGVNIGLAISWAPVLGYTSYAVFVGTTSGTGNCHCECIVPYSQVTLTSLAGTGILANAASIPTSTSTYANETLTYDGMLYQINAGGGYVKALSGTLTGKAPTGGASTGGEIMELQDAFTTIYGTAKVGKFRIIVSGKDHRTLTRLGVTSGAMQIFATPSSDGRVNFVTGASVGSIVNSVTGDVCDIQTDPWLPPGTIFILPTAIPYPDANVSSPFEWVGSYDWMRFDYSAGTATGPVFPFDIRCNGVLEALFPGGCGLIYNIYGS